MSRPRAGFTLVEVLIAAVILFATITVVTDSYRTSVAASLRATITAELLTPLPFITANIRNSLRQQPVERLTGDGKLLGVKYQYEAVSVRFEAPPPAVAPEIEGNQILPRRYRLYDVHLSLAHRTMERQFTYQELAWLPNLE